MIRDPRRDLTPAALLGLLGAKACTTPGRRLVLAEQRDESRMWGGASIHPMQPLESGYRAIVLDAARGVADADQKWWLEYGSLAGFFQPVEDPPAILGAPDDGVMGTARFPADILERAGAEIDEAAKAFNRAVEMGTVGKDAKLRPFLQKRLGAAFGLLKRVAEEFQYALGAYPPAALIESTKPVRDALKLIADLGSMVPNVSTVDVFVKCVDGLRQTKKHLEGATRGLASVHVLHTLEPFLLFRLLILFTLESETEISSSERQACGGELTKLLHAGRPWLSDFLRTRLMDLDAALKALDPSGNTRFFLKGGRALYCYLGTPQLGAKDWDTQVLINPHLPAGAWYELYRRVQNELELRLARYKQQFFMLLHLHARDLEQDLLVPKVSVEALTTVEAEAEFLEPLGAVDPGDAHGGECKAELIDVTIPRPDTSEALEQWAHLSGEGGILTMKDWPPVPGGGYYVEEYLTILREVTSEVSHSADKAPTRIERLWQVLATGPDIQGLVKAAVQALPDTLEAAVVAVQDVGDTCAQRLLFFGLRQFSESYGLREDVGLAAAFAKAFSETCEVFAKTCSRVDGANNPANGGVIRLPQSLVIAVEKARNGPKALAWEPVINAVGFLQYWSDRMERHWADRSRGFLKDMLSPMNGLFRMLAEDGVFSPTEELELQLAARGADAARLQAEYASFPRPTELDPLCVMELGVYLKPADGKTEVAIAIVRPLVERFVNSSSGAFWLDASDPSRLAVFSNSAIPFEGGAAYQPLVMSIEGLNSESGWPTLSFVWGQPILGLAFLVGEYRRAAALAPEFGVRGRLGRTASALAAILTQFENQTKPDPTVEALIAGSASFLTLSSTDRLCGARAQYPPMFFAGGKGTVPFHAFELELPANGHVVASVFDDIKKQQKSRCDLSLLVVNQARGSFELFSSADWKPSDMLRFVTKPMGEAGLAARRLVLDFPQSASFLNCVRLAAASDGQVWCTLYDAGRAVAPVIDTAAWSRLEDALVGRDVPMLDDGIYALLRQRTRAITGESRWSAVTAASPEQIIDWLRQPLAIPETISFIRCLPRIAAALALDGLARDDGIVAELQKIAREAWISPADGAVLAPVLRTTLSDRQRIAQSVAALKLRLVDLLTNPRFHVGLAREQLGGLPPFTPLGGIGESLWSLVFANRFVIASYDGMLPTCPSPFGHFFCETGQMIVDESLMTLAPVTGSVNPLRRTPAEMIGAVNGSAPGAFVEMLKFIGNTSNVKRLTGIKDFLQP
ncbi:MAG: hypothetical protein ACKVZJ_14030 [Phycisphaerales bacterium]